MDVAAVHSVLGQSLGRLTPQVAGAEEAPDAAPGFGDMFDDLAEAVPGQSAHGDLPDDSDGGAAAQEPASLAETVLFFPTSVPLVPDSVTAVAEGTLVRADGALRWSDVLPKQFNSATGEAVDLTDALSGGGQTPQTLPEGAERAEPPGGQAGRLEDLPPAPGRSVAPHPDAGQAGKGQLADQPPDRAAQQQAPQAPSQPLPAHAGRDQDLALAPAPEKPLVHEDKPGAAPGQEAEVPERAGPPPDRRLPIGFTGATGLHRGEERRAAPDAAVGRRSASPLAEPASRSASDAGRLQEGREDGQAVQTGFAVSDGKDSWPRPKAANPLPEPGQTAPFGLADGGPGRTHAPQFGPDAAGPPPPRPSGPALSHMTHNPRVIGMQLAAKMPAMPGQPVEITLAPDELGKVRMTLSATDGALTLQLVADRPETLDLLRRHIDQLAQDFRAMGFERLSFAFGQGQREGQQPGQAMPAIPPEEEAAHDGVAPTAGLAPARAPLLPQMPNDRLDLRF